MVETKEAPEKEEPKQGVKIAAPVAPVAEPEPSRKLEFRPAGEQRRLKNITTVKAFDPGGALVQLPVADQINNNVAGSDQLIGLRHYIRKGFDVLWDFEANVGAYCPMGDCFAEWNDEFRGYCCEAHQTTMDVRENPGFFGTGVTTSAAWRRTA